MDASMLDFNTVTLLVAILGSWLTAVTMIVRQTNRHEDSIKALDTKLSGEIKDLDAKFTREFKDLDAKFTREFKTVHRSLSDGGERLARVEGHLMAPGGFTVRSPHQSVAGDPPAEDADHREAG